MLVAMYLRQAVAEIEGVMTSRPVAMSVCPYIYRLHLLAASV